MSSGLSSDQIVKFEIRDNVRKFPGIKLRLFTQGSNEDQKLVSDGGLTFSYDGIDYGSCDAGWFLENEDGLCVALIGLEGTDALNRGSSGDAQYQRFHHALGAVKNGKIGIYYLRPGSNSLQLDLYKMAYNATIYENNGGYYLITQDLEDVNSILEIIVEHGYKSPELKSHLLSYVENMNDIWTKQKFTQYRCDWAVYADKRSTILFENYVVKYNGRMKRNFTDSSQRAGHIAVGEMYLTKYLFYGKKVYYLSPRMTQKDIDDLDTNKTTDKEWNLLRSEADVYYKTRDDIIGLPKEIYDLLQSIESAPLKNGSDAMKTYKKCLKYIVDGLKSGELKIRE